LGTVEVATVAVITVGRNGPYVVEGDDLKVADWNGIEYRPVNRSSFALCRCGGSTSKPFCDGTHSRIGFAAAQAAVRNSDA
jgi:CDGSH-type Zn-finger protein